MARGFDEQFRVIVQNMLNPYCLKFRGSGGRFKTNDLEVGTVRYVQER